VLLILAVSGTGIHDHDLWSPHECRVAAMVKEMADSGDFVVPTLGGRPLVHKPPLYYATGALLYRWLGGEPARTIRLTSLLFGLLALAATARIAFLYAGRREALAATAVLATTLGFLHLSHYIVVDSALVAFVAVAFWALLESRKRRPGCRWMIWIAAAGAFLTKGPIGPALIFPATGVFLLWERDYRGILRLGMFRGFLLFAALISSWLIPLYLRDDGQLFRHWLMDENVSRFLADASIRFHHDEPFYFYVPGLVVVLLPWTPWFAAAAWMRMRARTASGGSRELERLALSWLMVGLVLLSLSRTKREIYVVPLLPACGLLLGAWLGTRERIRLQRTWIRGMAAVAIGMLPALLVAHGAGWLSYPRPSVTFPLGLIVAVAAWYSIRTLERHQNGAGRPAFWLAPCLVFIQAAVLFVPPVNEYSSQRGGMQRLEGALGGRRVATYRAGETMRGSLSFHLDCRPHEIRHPQDLRTYLASPRRDERLLIRTKRWPFQVPADERFPGFERIVHIAGTEGMVVLRPEPEAAALLP
jgi:4-amino-4-deoxy-L-arabinose transferase-like glycosyltransferase